MNLLDDGRVKLDEGFSILGMPTLEDPLVGGRFPGRRIAFFPCRPLDLLAFEGFPLLLSLNFPGVSIRRKANLAFRSFKKMVV